MRQVSGIVKEHASTPLSQNQVWFMRPDSAGDYPFMSRGRDDRAKRGRYQVALSQPEMRRDTDNEEDPIGKKESSIITV